MSEILMVDAEMGYIDSFEDVLRTAEEFIVSTIHGVREEGQ
jgi:aspartyl/asparaginyl-tRNA synthetase